MHSDFYERIKSFVDEEAKDGNKYAEIAKIAPTEKARKILTDISHEEEIHRKFLLEILSDCDSSKSSEKEDSNSLQSVSHTKHGSDNEIDYPDSVENVGVDEDVLAVTDTKSKKG